MDLVLKWIRKHKFATFLICVALFAAPLLIVHILFKWKPGIEWIAAEWLAGDVLAYIAGFEAFLGTTALGLVTVYQSQKATEESERLSKENNFLQKISVQKLLPLIRVTSTEVQKACTTTRFYTKEKACTVSVSDKVTAEKRETHLLTYLPLLGDQLDRYQKTVKLTVENISDSAIRQICIDRIEFSSFTYQSEIVPLTCCLGIEQAKSISWLLLPGESLPIIIDIFFDNSIYKKFWEFEEKTSIGYFSMCLYLTNRSLSGIESKEKIYIEKAVGFTERVLYKAYEEETGDA